MTSTAGSQFVKKSRQPSLRKHGDIFVVPQVPPKTFVLKHQMTRNEKLKFLLVRSLGNFLLLLSIYGAGATFGPALFLEVQFQIAKARGIEYPIAKPSPIFSPEQPEQQPVIPGFGDIIAGAKEQVLIPPDPHFSLVIPKIGAATKVWPNVDSLDEKDFLPKLQSGVAHAKGTVFPGMQGNIYLFAHSTDNFWNVGRYNAIFYLLKELKPGDPISVYFEDRRYNYVVDHSVVKDPSDVDLLVKSQEPGKEQLILQTCWPPGTTWKRLFVIASPQ